MANNENANITGLESSSNFVQDEKSLIAALLEAADYKSSNEENTRTIKVKKNDNVLFAFRIRALSQSEIDAAAKKATKQIPNPAGPKYPAISGERSRSKYHNYLIYTATVEEDRKKIWGNSEFKLKKDILDEADSVDIILKGGIKSRVVDEILKLSGFNDDDIVDEEEYIKN